MKRNLKLLVRKMCSLSTEKIKKVWISYLQSKNFKRVHYTDNYIIAEGDLPLCLIAHMDTVFKYQPAVNSFFYDADKEVLWYPFGAGFDDRAGIAAIYEIIESGYRPSIILTDGEERGCIGSSALINNIPKCPFKDCRCLIQLDRTHKQDMVFYDCGNVDFIKYIGKFGFKEDFGTFSDISILAPAWDIAAVNLSVGYYLEHSASEYLNLRELKGTIKKVKKILDKSQDMPFFPYFLGQK